MTAEDEQLPGGEIVRLGTELITDPGLQAFVARLGGSPAHEVGEWLADQIRYRRWRRQVRMIVRAYEMLTDAGIPFEKIKPVDLTILVPLLESGSLDEDDSMSDRWAALLARAAVDPDGVPPSYPEILRQLTPREARMLDMAYREHGENWQDAVFSPGGFEVGIGTRIFIALDNLVRLRLLRYANTWSGVQQNPESMSFTPLGSDFVAACLPPTGQRPQ